MSIKVIKGATRVEDAHIHIKSRRCNAHASDDKIWLMQRLNDIIELWHQESGGEQKTRTNLYSIYGMNLTCGDVVVVIAAFGIIKKAFYSRMIGIHHYKSLSSRSE